ncbi:endoplasmic reticulum-based factor for assembly of V-ATPase-domain-containing protein [Parasitella parasitica]|nr:endoplasmic reticulum-based factor for assembly of V-ATPase-domain-containing protein [Parasitella parasitica]
MDLRLTQSIQDSIKKAVVLPDFSEKFKDEAEKISKLKVFPKDPYPVSTDLVEYIARRLDLHFHELIIGSGLYFAPKEVPVQDPKFLAYLDKLRTEQQERAYNKMVSGVITSEDQKFNLGIKPDELKEVKSHIATIFNILFSMVAVYVAVYKVSQSIFNDLGLQVLVALAGSFFIGTVEVILYAKYAYAATSEKKKTKNRKIATL